MPRSQSLWQKPLTKRPATTLRAEHHFMGVMLTGAPTSRTSATAPRCPQRASSCQRRVPTAGGADLSDGRAAERKSPGPSGTLPSPIASSTSAHKSKAPRAPFASQGGGGTHQEACEYQPRAHRESHESDRSGNRGSGHEPLRQQQPCLVRAVLRNAPAVVDDAGDHEDARGHSDGRHQPEIQIANRGAFSSPGSSRTVGGRGAWKGGGRGEEGGQASNPSAHPALTKFVIKYLATCELAAVPTSDMMEL